MSTEKDNYSGNTTRLDCIIALQNAAKTLGHSPSRPEYKQLDIQPSASEIRRVCGSWNNGKELAGLEQIPQKNKWTTEECLAALQNVATSLGYSPSRSEYRKLGVLPSARTIERTVGSFTEAKEELGLETYDKAMQTAVTREDCIQSMITVAQENGLERPPKVVEYRESGQSPSAKTIGKKFADGWSEAKEIVSKRI